MTMVNLRPGMMFTIQADASMITIYPTAQYCNVGKQLGQVKHADVCTIISVITSDDINADDLLVLKCFVHCAGIYGWIYLFNKQFPTHKHFSIIETSAENAKL